MTLEGKTVLLGVTGSIAAYKIAYLASALKKRHADVHVLMTENATNFINPITFETLTGNKCLVDTFDRNFQFQVERVSIAKQADMSKIEPAKRPLLNPTLELSGIYFMQELRRPVEKDQHGNLRELEEELIVNLKKSEYLVAMNVDPEDPKNCLLYTSDAADE